MADRLRAALPKPLWECVRKVSNAVLGPLHFSIETGHLRSSFASLAMDRHGNPLPWFTYSAIQFLLKKSFKERTVLEWGAGQSTLFWAQRAKTVTALEADEAWHKVLLTKVPCNVALHLVKADISDVEPILQNKTFDIVVCDGLDRFKCAERSLNLITNDGAIIIDNSDGNQGPRPGFGFIDLYFQAGFSRIDFYGFPPGNTVQQCTSVLFRKDCFLLRGEEHPWAPLSYWEYPDEVVAAWQQGGAPNSGRAI